MSNFKEHALIKSIRLQRFATDLNEIVGCDDFEVRCLTLLRESELLPIGVAHACRFYPKTQRTKIVDERGVVENEHGPIERLIDTFSTELPAFKVAVESAEEPAALSMYQSRAEIEKSTIWNAVIRPFGMADVLNLPLMQAETRHSVMVASPRVFDERDLEFASLLRRQIIAAMRNHYWLKHAEANGRHIEEVRGKSIILEMDNNGTFPRWEEAVSLFSNGNRSGFPSLPPAAIVSWFTLHIAEYPLQATDLNRAEFQVGETGAFRLHTAFLGDRQGRHRLLLYLPGGVPDTFALTKREIETLSWICRGYGNKDIATVLGISLHTVRRHVEKILDKLHVVSRTEAASMARGWFED